MTGDARPLLRWSVRLLLLAPAAGLLGSAALLGRSWWVRHAVIPACYLPPAEWTLPALRVALAVAGLALVVCAVRVRNPSPGGVLRVSLSVLLSFAAAELALRVIERPESRTPHPRLEWLLGAADARTGWSFVPHRALRFGAPGGGPVVDYAVEAHGDRAPSPYWVEDPAAPTLLIAGESIAAGHGLSWSDTFGARVGEALHLQVVNVAEGGYGSDQAYLRTVDALKRLARPVALVMTVLPVQLHRNLDDSRPHLVLRDGSLLLAPAVRPRIRLRELLVDELPLMPSSRITRSEGLTRAILQATARAAEDRGARPLFVVPSYGPRRALDAHPEAEIVHAVLDGLPYVVVDLDPARIMPWDGHPDAEGARELADAIVQALK